MKIEKVKETNKAESLAARINALTKFLYVMSMSMLQ